jgi:hypothetical protein
VGSRRLRQINENLQRALESSQLENPRIIAHSRLRLRCARPEEMVAFASICFKAARTLGGNGQIWYVRVQRFLDKKLAETDRTEHADASE